MFSHRPYGPALGGDKALEEVKKGKEKLATPKWWILVLNLLLKRNLSFKK